MMTWIASFCEPLVLSPGLLMLSFESLNQVPLSELVPPRVVDVVHKIAQLPKVMHEEQYLAQQLTYVKEVVHVGAGVTLTSHALAAGL